MKIIAGLLSLNQYVEVLKNAPDACRLEKCLCCGKANPWHHGGYQRKADRSNSGNISLNPIVIQRFFCPDCHHTFSVLPECIPPRRWYLWEVLQAALLLSITGISLRAVASKSIPARHTIKRWTTRFEEQFCQHKDILCNYFTELGRTINFSSFWESCLRHIPLSKAMQLCHASGATIP